MADEKDSDLTALETDIDESEDPQDFVDETEGDVRRDCAAVPTRLAFCTTWALRGRELDIVDEFEALAVRLIPFRVLESEPIFLAVFWNGFGGYEKPHLDIETPSGARFALILPALKAFFSKQVQMNSLAGFCFRERGTYRFTISTTIGRVERILIII